MRRSLFLIYYSEKNSCQFNISLGLFFLQPVSTKFEQSISRLFEKIKQQKYKISSRKKQRFGQVTTYNNKQKLVKLTATQS